MNDYQIGMVCAVTQNIIGYPLDTYKVRLQTSKVTINSNVFRGMSVPLACNIVTTGINYGLFNDCQKRFNNSFMSGFISGLVLTPIVNIGENYKIKGQLGQFGQFGQFKPKTSLRDISDTMNFRRGLGLCSVRDSIGCSIYFGFYTNFPDYFGSFINGGIAGMASWLITFPIDTIKTRFQSCEKETIISAYKKGNLFHGVYFCLVRAFLVNASSFFIYDKLKSS